MREVIICSILNLFFCSILCSALYKMWQNYTVLGEQKVKFKLSVLTFKGSLWYRITIFFDNNRIWQIISKEEYEKLKNSNTEYANVYIRKYNSKFTPNGAKYEFRLYDIDWKSFDKKSMAKVFYFMLIVYEFLIITIGFQIYMPS